MMDCDVCALESERDALKDELGKLQGENDHFQEVYQTMKSRAAKYREALETMNICDCRNGGGNKTAHSKACSKVICEEALNEQA